MFVGEDTAGASEADKNHHDELEDEAEGFVLDVVGEDEGNEEEDGGDDHDVTRGEGRLAGAIGAGI